MINRLLLSLALVLAVLLLMSAPMTTRAALAVVGVNDTGRTVHDRALVVPAPGVLGNDLNLVGGTSVSLVSGVSHGTLALRADGGYTYTPDAGYVGSDSFRYRPSGLLATAATVNLTVTNAAPVARNDAFTTVGRTTLVVRAPGVLANDSDADGDALAVELSSGGVSGSLDLEPDGSLVYSPGGGASGSVTFRYRVWDGVAWSAEATVTVTILAATPTPQPTPRPTPTPTPVLPLPSLPLPSLPLPSVSLPSPLLPLPLPTPLPAVSPTPPSVGPGGPTPTPRPTPSARGEDSPVPGDDGPAGTPAPSSAEQSTAPGAAPPQGGPGEAPPAAAQRLSTDPAADAPHVVFDPARMELAIGPLGLLDGATVWIVPAATIGVPGLLILAWVVLQTAGVAAWIPAVRRLRGEEPDARRV